MEPRRAKPISFRHFILGGRPVRIAATVLSRIATVVNISVSMKKMEGRGDPVYLRLLAAVPVPNSLRLVVHQCGWTQKELLGRLGVNEGTCCNHATLSRFPQ